MSLFISDIGSAVMELMLFAGCSNKSRSSYLSSYLPGRGMSLTRIPFAYPTSSAQTFVKMLTSDEKLLASLGYKQELRRVFTPWELITFGFSFIGVAPSLSSILIYSLPNGGPCAMVWGWAACTTILLICALAMGELGSAAPTSGGLYYWTHSFSSPRYKNVASWMVGYCNTMGYITGTASVSWGLAVQVMAAVSISTDSAFVPTTGQTYGVFVASLVFQGVLCSSAAKYVARIQNLFTLINVLLCITIIVGLPIATPHEFRNTARYTFGHFEKSTSWPSGFAFILSFIAPMWTLSGLDGSVHISEEASNASIAVPATIVGVTFIGGILGWAINVALAFNMGTDLAALIDSPIGQPMATILMNSFGKTGALVIWVFVILTQFMIGVNVVIVASRQAFAFSRDGALPLSRFIRRVNAHTHTPVVAVWFVTIVAMIVGLLAFAGPAAVNAIFSLAVVGFFLADSIPVSARFLGKNDFRPGPFTLGKFGLPVAVLAVFWMWFMIIILMFPPSPNPTATTMNYIVVVTGSVILLSLAYYFCPKYGGRYWFKGPIRTVDDLVAPEGSVSISPDGDPEKEAGEKYDSSEASVVVI